MKKNRPAYQVNVICKKEDAEKLEKLIFQGTTTIGIRRMYMERSILKREAAEIDTPIWQNESKSMRSAGWEKDLSGVRRSRKNLPGNRTVLL